MKTLQPLHRSPISRTTSSYHTFPSRLVQSAGFGDRWPLIRWCCPFCFEKAQVPLIRRDSKVPVIKVTRARAPDSDDSDIEDVYTKTQPRSKNSPESVEKSSHGRNYNGEYDDAYEGSSKFENEHEEDFDDIDDDSQSCSDSNSFLLENVTKNKKKRNSIAGIKHFVRKTIKKKSSSEDQMHNSFEEKDNNNKSKIRKVKHAIILRAKEKVCSPKREKKKNAEYLTRELSTGLDKVEQSMESFDFTAINSPERFDESSLDSGSFHRESTPDSLSNSSANQPKSEYQPEMSGADHECFRVYNRNNDNSPRSSRKNDGFVKTEKRPYMNQSPFARSSLREPPCRNRPQEFVIPPKPARLYNSLSQSFIDCKLTQNREFDKTRRVNGHPNSSAGRPISKLRYGSGGSGVVRTEAEVRRSSASLPTNRVNKAIVAARKSSDKSESRIENRKSEKSTSGVKGEKKLRTRVNRCFFLNFHN